ncbi:hypothetical protein SAMN04487965_3691 [Microbulbifer donghaiensis]|uniref:Uncharacterized protein n=1 Tax=Microbulbifer donghaiensis TaxID=494016 RepID=A0A1M5ILD7_9GAMM|nr:hypothetical protein [Microbulbifer donghaiensis]SHG28593.1 hypothetical protein SAMN04487965_3691 [Microbulbifer donghaiensis]
MSDQVASQENRNFEIFCEQFANLVKAESYPTMTAQERAEKLDSLLIERIPVSSNAYQAWAAIRNAAPSQRSSLYESATISVGIKDWNCPAVEERSSQVGSN